MNTKNVLMLVVLSAGMLAGLTATAIQATPAYAEKEECEKNSDNNCNEVKDRGQSITQENHCSVEDGGSGDANGGAGGTNGGAGGTNGGNDNHFSCSNTILDPNTGNDAFNGPQQ